MTGRMCRRALMLALLVVMIGIAAVVVFDAERAAPGATEGIFVRPFFWLWIAVFGATGARGMASSPADTKTSTKVRRST